jgi:hypothetical protein
MGCGCNKNKKDIKKITITNVPIIKKESVINNESYKLNKCNSCKFNSRKNINGRCLKSNRLISNIIKDINFSCPIKRF